MSENCEIMEMKELNSPKGDKIKTKDQIKVTSADRLLKTITKIRNRTEEDKQRLVNSLDSSDGPSTYLVASLEPTTSPEATSQRCEIYKLRSEKQSATNKLRGTWRQPSPVDDAEKCGNFPDSEIEADDVIWVRRSSPVHDAIDAVSVAIVDRTWAEYDVHQPSSQAFNLNDSSTEICRQGFESISLSSVAVERVQSSLKNQENSEEVIENEADVVTSRQTSTSKRKGWAGGRRRKFRRRKKGESRVRFDVLINENENGSQQTNLETKKKKKIHTKRLAKKAGKRLWKGFRISCKFLWSGLVLYAKPFGAMNPDSVAKAWEESRVRRKDRQHYTYNDPLKYKVDQKARE